jgi:hypothetical protein
MVTAFIQQALTRRIEEPHVPEFLHPALIMSSIMEELKRYTNSILEVANL